MTTDLFNSVRVVATSALPSYSVQVCTLTAGTTYGPVGTKIYQKLTATAPGALPPIDGVTLGIGDSLLLAAGASQVDQMPYGVEDPGSPSTPWVLHSIGWVARKNSDRPFGPESEIITPLLNASEVFIRDGTWAGANWVLWTPSPTDPNAPIEAVPPTARSIILGTNPLLWWPRISSGTVTLSGGAATVSGLWVRPGTTGLTVTDVTVPGGDVTGVLTSGAGTGSLAITGEGSDVIAWTLDNLSGALT